MDSQIVASPRGGYVDSGQMEILLRWGRARRISKIFFKLDLNKHNDRTGYCGPYESDICINIRAGGGDEMSYIPVYCEGIIESAEMERMT